MEILDVEAPFDVIIDYAHSPDSLKNYSSRCEKYLQVGLSWSLAVMAIGTRKNGRLWGGSPANLPIW